MTIHLISWEDLIKPLEIKTSRYIVAYLWPLIYHEKSIIFFFESVYSMYVEYSIFVSKKT